MVQDNKGANHSFKVSKHRKDGGRSEIPLSLSKDTSYFETLDLCDASPAPDFSGAYTSSRWKTDMKNLHLLQKLQASALPRLEAFYGKTCHVLWDRIRLT